MSEGIGKAKGSSTNGRRLRRAAWFFVLVGLALATYAIFFRSDGAPIARVVPAASGEVATATTPDEVELPRNTALPPPPEGFVREQIGSVIWVYPSAMVDLATSLQSTHADAWTMLQEDLGKTVDPTMEIRLARNPEEMRELAPRFAPPPAYATGVAYTGHGLILLSAVAPETWEVPDLETVFVHELSHIALRRAVSGHPLPRWFVEGVAIVHAKEATFNRLKVLWQGQSSGELMPLDELSRSFPARPYEVNLAYAQAADVVGFLRSGDGDDRKFKALIDELEEGDGFESALSDAYALTPGQLERDWRDALRERVSSLPLLVGMSTVWTFAAFLLILARRRRRQDHRRRLAAMAAREKADARAIARIEAMAIEEPWNAVMDQLQRSETDIPTVQHDGEDHTLH